MKRWAIGKLLIGFIVSLVLSIVSVFVDFKPVNYIIYGLCGLSFLGLVYVTLKKVLGGDKIIRFLVPFILVCFIILVTILVQFPLLTDFNKDLILTANFDHIENNQVLDISGKGNNGTIYGAKVVKGVKGNALEFDGVDDYVEINTTNFPSGFPEGLTLSFWMEGYNLTGDRRDSPISRLGEHQFFTYSRNNEQNLIVGAFTDGKEISKTCELEDKWNSIIFSIDNDLKVLVNGKLCVKGTDKIKLDQSHANVFLGKYYNNRNFYNGRLDEVSVYNRSFNEEELKILYLKQKYVVSSFPK